MEINFSKLKERSFVISDILAERQVSDCKKRFVMSKPRPTDALMLFSKADSICYQESEPPLHIPCGSLVYVPKNSKYVWEDSPAFDDNILEKLLFEFTLYFVKTSSGKDNEVCISSVTKERISFSNKVCILTTDFFGVHKEKFEKLIFSFKNQQKSLLGVYTAAYDLFNAVVENCSVKEKLNSNIIVIEKGIRYLEANPITDKSVKEIADMCGVCIGHFEHLFKCYANVSPIEYINNNKILFIKNMLQDNSVTLNEITEKMNFCDTGYLCRFFKKRTGMSPKEYRHYFNSIKSSDV